MLEGKNIVITGAGRGIGAAYAEAAADLGAAVVVNDVDAQPAEEVAEMIRAGGGKAVAHAADISSWNDAGALIERCVGEFGSIDGLVNNAGLFRVARVEEMAPEDVQAILAVNVMGTAYCTHHAVKEMIPRGSGSIVNITSGAHMGILTMGIYGASKGAVASFTYTWALELGDLGIRVNAVSPLGKSRMGQVTRDYRASRGLPAYGAGQPAPELNAPLVCYLLSDRSAAINGQIVRIEGRQLSLVAHPMIAVPVLEDDWTVERIAQAFDDDLGKRQLPIGIHSAEVRPVDVGSAYWSQAAD